MTNRIPFSSDVYKYQDSPTFNWKMEHETDTIFGYLCHKASTTFRGRDYSAWYTTDIPVQVGPWKFSGLPGLILKVQDRGGDYLFECIGLNQRPNDIRMYDWKYKEVTREEWATFEKQFYKRAGQFINSNSRVIIMDKTEKGFHKLSDSWEAIYNPMEKE